MKPPQARQLIVAIRQRLQRPNENATVYIRRDGTWGLNIQGRLAALKGFVKRPDIGAVVHLGDVLALAFDSDTRPTVEERARRTKAVVSVAEKAGRPDDKAFRDGARAMWDRLMLEG